MPNRVVDWLRSAKTKEPLILSQRGYPPKPVWFQTISDHTTCLYTSAAFFPSSLSSLLSSRRKMLIPVPDYQWHLQILHLNSLTDLTYQGTPCRRYKVINPTWLLRDMASHQRDDDLVSDNDSEIEVEESLSSAQSARQEQNARFNNLLDLPGLHYLEMRPNFWQFSKNRISQAAKDLNKKEASHQSAVENTASTRYLLASQDFAATINDPRDYQIELYERAKTENTIAVLATGLPLLLIFVLKEMEGAWQSGILYRIWQDADCCTSPKAYHSERADRSRTW